MKRNRWILCDGAILGFSGVLAGALLDHAAARFVVLQHAADTALRYHQLHAVVLTYPYAENRGFKSWFVAGNLLR